MASWLDPPAAVADAVGPRRRFGSFRLFRRIGDCPYWRGDWSDELRPILKVVRLSSKAIDPWRGSMPRKALSLGKNAGGDRS
jgi:hypothetical protein